MQITSSIIEGFITGAGLIIAIGAQNAYVLRQGILGRHRALLAWVCSLSDALLITLGIAGMGFVFTSHPAVTKAAAGAGALYLLWFAFKSFRSAVKGESMDMDDAGGSGGLKESVITIFALTYLNPHVYLDTVVMLGGFGAARPHELQPFFGLGAVAASFAWFFALAYSGRILAPLFRKPLSWRILDTVIGFVMVYIAFRLVLFAYGKV
ncbi:MAG TPA: LysE/ArgO family amino acid transporter [Spirochaetota bacterium]|nr:LysE/ArgO family amino acid transporter [Spirochaetota bacterium]